MSFSFRHNWRLVFLLSSLSSCLYLSHRQIQVTLQLPNKALLSPPRQGQRNLQQQQQQQAAQDVHVLVAKRDTTRNNNKNTSHHLSSLLPPLQSLIQRHANNRSIDVIGNIQPLMNVVVAGFAKCGTSSLHQWLRSHPQVCMPAGELYYLHRNPGQQIRRLHKHFTSHKCQSKDPSRRLHG